MALGLLVDGKIDLAMNIVDHCIFEIKHYNKVLNGNRSYVSKAFEMKLMSVPLPISTALLHGPSPTDFQPARSD